MKRYQSSDKGYRSRLSQFTTTVSIATLMAGIAACSTQPNSKIALDGAGASLPAPLYEQWVAQYERQHPGIRIDYDAIGSGAGIEQFLAQEVDFAATDVPLSAEEMEQFPEERGDVVQVPMVGSAVVLAYNLDGVESLQLSRDAYCGIAAGEIISWNDPAIAADNPNADLPDLPITFVHRADSSGTTYIFTNHLNAACDRWAAGVGKVIDWASEVAAPGNAGVTATIQQTEGAIGYVGFAHAEKQFMPMASLENQSGFFIEPSPNSAELATATLDAADALTTTMPDPSRPDAYPIVGLTYMLMYENYPDTMTSEAVCDFIKWALADGRPMADALGYAPLSYNLVAQVAEILDVL